MPRSITFNSFSDWETAYYDNEVDTLPVHLAEKFLVQAVMDDNANRVNRILEYSAWTSSPSDQTEHNPVVLALKLGHSQCLEVFLNHSDCEQWSFEHGQTLLHFAVKYQALWSLEMLIEKGAALNQPDASRMTPVTLASLQSPEILKVLLEHATRLKLPFENERMWEWEKTYPASALSLALCAYAKAINEHAPQKEIDYLQVACDTLYLAGSNPNTPIGALALICHQLSRFTTASAEKIAPLLKLAVTSYGCDWQIPGFFKKYNALELAAHFSAEPIFEILLALGADGNALSKPTAYYPLSNLLTSSSFGSDPISPNDEILSFIQKHCEQDHFYPPFAPTPEALREYFSKKNTRSKSQRQQDAEQLELYMVTFSKTSLPKQKPLSL